MKVDAPLSADLEHVGEEAQEVESIGYDGAFSFEGAHDPFMPLAIAAERTDHIDLMTAIAIAFVRSPVTFAAIAWDLQKLSHGRFILGLGSQIRAHIVNRFSMPWSHPAARMREMILAIRAVWTTWQEGVPLNFQGEFFRHTLMTPFHNPGPNEFGFPRIFLAGVGKGMTEVAGEVADGFIVHPFSTQKYVQETTWPALQRGLERGGRTAKQFEVAWQLMVSTADPERQATVDRSLRERVAFYASTPAFRSVLEAHGWGELQPELRRLSKSGEWDAMPELISDEMVDTFAVRSGPDDLADMVMTRTAGLATRVNLDYRRPLSVPSSYETQQIHEAVGKLRGFQ
jgi:probable F420-dependent oxidoreductase